MLDDHERNGTGPYLQKMFDILEPYQKDGGGLIFQNIDGNRTNLWRIYRCDAQHTSRTPNCRLKFFAVDVAGHIANEASCWKVDIVHQNVAWSFNDFFKFQVIGFAETNVEDYESQIYQLDWYKQFYKDNHVNKASGTSAVL